MKTALLVALGGAIGSVLRWMSASWAQSHFPGSPFPWGTLGVNVAGSFAIGVLLTLALERAWIGPDARMFLVAGVLGGFTTFSAFSWESLQLLRDGHWPAAAGYVLGSVVLGLGAAFAGHALAVRL